MIENQVRREDIGYRLCKALEVRGLTPTLALETGVVPVVLVEDLSRGNEQDFQTNRWARAWGSTPGVAGQYSKLSFNNQVDSGVLMKVYGVDLFHPVGGRIGITIETAFATGTLIQFQEEFQDSRVKQGNPGPPRLPTMELRYDASIGLGGHFMRPFVPTTGFHVEFGGLILRPGTRLHFEGLDVLTSYDAHVEWTERNA